MYRPKSREPNFQNLADVLERRVPSRPTLFEFYLNDRLIKTLTKPNIAPTKLESIVRAYDSAGYDYTTVKATKFEFIDNTSDRETISLNANSLIYDKKSFDDYEWKNPDDYSIEEFENLKDILPPKMKLIVWGPSGVLENTIAIVGYENLCLMIYDDPQLVYDIFDKVGSSLFKYYKRVMKYDFVGAIISNDDWGFNTQTLLAPNDLRRFVFPWHKKYVQMAHENGKYAILHSCGNYHSIINDVINDLKFDARHSYEDTITPVEEAYDELHDKIAILGGIDVDYMTRNKLENITKRARNMVNKQMTTGGYALGTGNSVPKYISDEHYFAMTKPIFE